MAASATNALTVLLVLAVFVLLVAIQMQVVSAADEVCNYEDDDGDGLCFGGSNDGAVCTVQGYNTSECPDGRCVTVDEDFTYQGIPVYGDCDGIGECGGGFVQCLNETTATCSTNPGGNNDQSQPEVCDYKDNDCDSVIDNGFEYQGIPVYGDCDGVGECGGGFVQCLNETTATCSTNPGGNNDQSQPETCNGLDDDCDGAVDDGGDALCANWSLPLVATCLYDPDGLDFTWDWFPGFGSVCQGSAGCTTYAGSGGSENWMDDITHECNVSECGAECEDDVNCATDEYCYYAGCSCELVGDTNRDGIVNGFDLAVVGAAYGSVPGDSNWNTDADVSPKHGDGKVDIADLTAVSDMLK